MSAVASIPKGTHIAVEEALKILIAAVVVVVVVVVVGEIPILVAAAAVAVEIRTATTPTKADHGSPVARGLVYQAVQEGFPAAPS
jgi:hypothetical protein